MQNLKCYIEIKKIKILTIIKTYKNSKSVKMYFKEGILNITKPVYCSKKEVMKIIHENEDKIYEEYSKINENFKNYYYRSWKTGDKFLYKGEDYTIQRNENLNKNDILKIEIIEEQKKIYIFVPNKEVGDDILNQNIKKLLKRILKDKLKYIIKSRLEIICKLTNISYNSFKITDAKSRYGSCIPKSRNLNFTLRLMMLDIEKIDAVIIHELCHIVYPNHSKNFYNLVRKYSPNYDEIDKWLKNNSYRLII